MAAPLDLTYEAPLGPVPDWLSYRINPTATVVLPFTVNTLAANGVPTAITGQATVTRYQTQLLQLPVTVTLPQGEERISLGPDYTTAGGDDPTIARVYGGTELVTLGPTQTVSQETTRMLSSASPAATTVNSRATAASGTLVSLSSVQASLAAALTSASLASESSLVSSLSSELSSISSAVGSAASSSSSSAISSSSPTVSSTSILSTSASSLSASPAASTGKRLESLTPSQLAAAIAAPICFFFLVLLLALVCCFCIRRRRRRRREEGDDNIFRGGVDGGGGGGGTGFGTGGSSWGGIGGRRTREASEDWDWVEPRMMAGSRMGGYFTSSNRSGSNLSSRAGTPLSRGPGGGPEGQVSLLAGGGRLADESPRYDNEGGAIDNYEGEEEEEDEGEIGTVMMRGRAQAAALGLGLASSSRAGTSLPERAAATLNAGLRRISGGRLGGDEGSSSEGYDYEPVRASAPHHEMVQTTTRPPYWDPYRPSPTTPQFPILAPVISATSSDEPSPRAGARGQYGDGSRGGEFSPPSTTSPDCDDIRRANLGLADLTNRSRWSERGSPRTDETNTYDDHDAEGDDEGEQESTEMLASSREDATRDAAMQEEGNWFRNGRPKLPSVLLPPLLRPPSDVSLSQYSQSEVGGARPRRSDQGSWLATPSHLDERNRSRENSGGSAASDVSLGSMGSLGGNPHDKLFFTAPRWIGSRNPNTFPTSTISPVIPSGLVGGHLTPPPSSDSSASSTSSSRYADAPITQPPSSTTRASFHTPRIDQSPGFPPPLSREGSGGELTTATIEDSPMVYSVAGTPNTRTTRRAGIASKDRRGRSRSARPDSEDVLESAAQSYERQRQRPAGAKPIAEEWKEIRLVGDSYDAPFSNLTPLSSPLLPSPPIPPHTASPP